MLYGKGSSLCISFYGCWQAIGGLHEARPRTTYSLRHTYICMRLMEGANICQIAKNCRTSVEMIEKYYASHIKTSLDAAAINIRRKKPAKKKDAQPDHEG